MRSITTGKIVYMDLQTLVLRPWKNPAAPLGFVAHKLRTSISFMVTPCINNIQHFIFQVMHTTLKNVELLKRFKIRKLLQHVSVYKETIIREPQPVLS